ncbi:nSTAND1 domain-containing NTPase [Catenulispora pinisilvae]|uniref:nSTAND1 domain-containing NTPase n=1 Tax=Catenulispora pinisilvae TaxID=2705253 RepID=UPI003F6A174C
MHYRKASLPYSNPDHYAVCDRWRGVWEAMVRRGRAAILLQLAVLMSASLLEVAANFAASDMQSRSVRLLVHFGLPAVVVLLLMLVVGNVLVFRLENPRSDRPAWDSQQAPYPGLSAFSEADAPVYFGRDAQVTELIRRLHTVDASAADRFVCVTGASGSGKSSLVHAGVLPRLRSRRWSVLPVVVPAGEPLTRLAAAFAAHTQADAAVLSERLRSEDFTLPATPSGRLTRVLLVLDQLEELVTLSGPAERELFLGAVARALAADRRLWVVATLRVEFLPELLGTAQADMFAAPVALGAMRPAELVAVIERPAALAGMALEPGLVADMVEDTGTVDALPLLAYLLQELYLAAGSGGVASREAYRALGGVAGALARQADAVFAELTDVYDADNVLRTLLRLVGMDGAEPTRRRVLVSDLSGTERVIVAAFTDARLLVTDSIDGMPSVQAAHEALFRQWPPLRQLVAARSEQLRSRGELERWTADWLRSGRSKDYLLTGERLALALAWLEPLVETGQASEEVKAFVALSRSRDRAFLERVSGAIGKYVLANVAQNPEFAILLTVAALTECPPTALARRALMASLTESHLEFALVGHTATVRSVAWSPNAHQIVTASRDGTARIWDAATGTTRHVLRGHDGMVEGAGWSPDSRLVATASRDRTVRIWDAATGACVVVLSGFGDFARGAAFSPDGARLAATSRDRLVRVFDTASWNQVTTLTGHSNDVWGVAWSPDSTRLASASHDKTAIIWDTASAQVVQRLDKHTNFVEGVAFSPDGTQLATTSGDNRVRIWDVADGRLVRTISGNRDPIWSVTWSPDGRSIAYASGNRTGRIWGIDHDEQLAELRGHSNVVWSIDWSPDGTRLLTGSDDTTARVWTATARGAEQQLLAGHAASVKAVTVNPDGTRAASGSHDGPLRIWDAATGFPLAVLPGHDGPVNAVAWSPDGEAIASCGNDNTVRLWSPHEQTHRVLLNGDVETEALSWAPDGTRLAAGGRDNHITILYTSPRPEDEPRQLTGHNDWVGALSWSPSGRWIASGSDDRTARIWDAETGTTVHELTGHQNWVDGVAWSPDETLLATCSGDWTIRIWDTTSGQLLHKLTGHERRVRAIAWSPDGTLLASVSDDHTVRTWNPHDDTEGEVVGVHADRVNAVAWLPDSQRIITGSTDTTIRIWSAAVDTNVLIGVARRRVARSLTAEERSAHLLPEQAP